MHDEHQWRQLELVANIADPDGDNPVLIELWDDTGANNWWVAGDYVDATAGFQTSNLGGVLFQGDSGAGSQNMWLRVYDGTAWSA